uniref:Uncharacterized protein n=1 Tax=Trypanosoma congolense (strain IL3000) TaxID=1068625 RepID=G0UIQ5_TRYCI|nr:conserved hypothetical protein [Trypanosoma congolense IL3000]
MCAPIHLSCAFVRACASALLAYSSRSTFGGYCSVEESVRAFVLPTGSAVFFLSCCFFEKRAYRRMLFIAASSKSHFVNLETRTIERTCVTTPVERRGLAYCAGTRVVAAHQSRGCVSFFSPATQQPLLRCFSPETITSCVCTSDGTYMLGGTAAGNLYVWSLPSGQLLHLIRSHTRCITEVAISSDQSLIATASEDSVCKTWLISMLGARGTSAVAPRAVYDGHSLAVNACSFLECNYSVVTASSDRSCRIFDGLTGNLQFVVTLDGVLTSVRSSPGDEVLLVGSETGSLFFLRLYTQQQSPCLPTGGLCKRNDNVLTCKPFAEGHDGTIVFIMFDFMRPDHVLVGSSNGVVLWWNSRTATPVGKAVENIAGGLSSICYVPIDALRLLKPTFPCVALQKHPLDPSGTDFTLVSTTGSESEEAARVMEVEVSRAPRRKRRRQRLQCAAGAEARCDGATVVVGEEQATTDNNFESPAALLRRLREKNDEAASLCERLKRKLLKLEAAN